MDAKTQQQHAETFHCLHRKGDPLVLFKDGGSITWDGDQPKAFTIAVPDGDLVDLRDRLGRTRWPDRTPGPDWALGVEPDYLRDLCAYWRDGYDWRRPEAALNERPNLKVTIGGIGVHFIHARGEGAR